MSDAARAVCVGMQRHCDPLGHQARISRQRAVFWERACGAEVVPLRTAMKYPRSVVSENVREG